MQPGKSPLVTLGRGIHAEKAKSSHIFSQVTLLLPTSLRCFREIIRERWKGGRDKVKREVRDGVGRKRAVEEEKKEKKGGRRKES